MWPSGTNTVKTQLWMSSPLTGQTSTVEARASVCLRGPNPTLHPLPHAVYFIYSLVTCSPARSQRLWQKQLASPCPPLSFCRCYRGLFVFRGPLFSSVASVSCSTTGGFTCLCVRLFLAIGQLNLLGPECSCAPAEPSKGSYCLWCSDLRSDGELGSCTQNGSAPGIVVFSVYTLNGDKAEKHSYISNSWDHRKTRASFIHYHAFYKSALTKTCTKHITTQDTHWIQEMQQCTSKHWEIPKKFCGLWVSFKVSKQWPSIRKAVFYLSFISTNLSRRRRNVLQLLLENEI